MPVLVAAVVLLGVVLLADLVLTLALVRRLRQHTELLLALRTGPPAELADLGSAVSPFTVTTTDGEVVSERDLLGAAALIGYFSPGCRPCDEEVPRFVAYAAGLADRGRVLAVVVAEDRVETTAETTAGTAAEVAALAAVARVVVSDEGGPVPRALGVHSYPAVFLLGSDGRVAGVGVGVDALPRLEAVS